MDAIPDFLVRAHAAHASAGCCGDTRRGEGRERGREGRREETPPSGVRVW